jgi:carboxynorspermidine decarboxylase
LNAGHLPTVPTPYYLIDETRLRSNLEIISQLRELSGAKILLALKCFSTWGVFPIIREHLDGTTSSSVYEARLGWEEFGGTGSPSGHVKEVHAYSVSYNENEIREAAEFSDKVIFNSVSQLERFADLVNPDTIGLRINPGISYSHFDLADPARAHSRLGVISEEDLRRVAGQLRGVMFHFNCENTDLGAFQTALAQISERYEGLLKNLSWVSLGGGISFTAPGYPVSELAATLRAFADQHQVQVYLEPGEAVITSTTELVTEVLDIVHNEVDIAILDVSIEAHMPDHLIYGTHPPVTAPALSDSADGHHVTLAGRTCLAGDVFGEYCFAAPLQVGDRVSLGDAAGYTMVKTNWFNGLAMPTIAVRDTEGQVRVIRQFGYPDFKGALS